MLNPVYKKSVGMVAHSLGFTLGHFAAKGREGGAPVLRQCDPSFKSYVDNASGR